MNYIFKLLYNIRKIFFESGYYLIYHMNAPRKEESLDTEVKIYEEFSDIPEFLRKELSLYPLINSMYHRIKSHTAKLICIYEDNKTICYGWIQSWKPFKNKFDWLYKDAVMLGPYWTHPDYRGKGYYGRLLHHSIAISDKDSTLVIYTSPENLSSQKGIEKIGFTKDGTFKINFVLRFFQWHNEID